MFIVSCKRKNHTYKFMINAKGQIHSSDSTCLTWDNIMTYLSKDLYYLNLITNSRTFPSVMAAPGVWAMFLMRKWDVTLLCFAFELEGMFATSACVTRAKVKQLWRHTRPLRRAGAFYGCHLDRRKKSTTYSLHCMLLQLQTFEASKVRMENCS